MPTDEHVLGLVTATTDVTAAIPADVYSDVALEAIYAARQLAGVVSFTEEDLTAKDGDTVQVPILGARTAQGPISEGAALTANASSITTVPVVLAKYGDYDLVNREVFEDQDQFNQDDFLTNMTEALAELVDQQVYDALETATPGESQALATAGNLADLYDQVVELRGDLKAGKRRPTHLIVHADHEVQFLKDTDEGIKLMQVTVRDGNLLTVAGLSVIVTPLANANTATLNEVQAIIIDRRRAVAEAWGRRPETIVDRVSRAEFDQVKLVTWIRYGVDTIEAASIGHVVNPAA